MAMDHRRRQGFWNHLSQANQNSDIRPSQGDDVTPPTSEKPGLAKQKPRTKNVTPRHSECDSDQRQRAKKGATVLKIVT